jgi:hypothetical protein
VAAPGIEALGKALGTFVESVGTAVSTVFKGLSESLVNITTNVDPMKLLALVPGIAGIGIALLPFGIGGALAGIVGAGGGFDAVVGGIQKFEDLDPVRLTAVAGAMKQINENMPSVTDLLKFDALHAVESVFGGDKGSSSSSTTAAAPTSKDDPMSKLVSLTEQTITNQKEMLRYLRDNASSSDKIHKALA